MAARVLANWKQSHVVLLTWELDRLRLGTAVGTSVAETRECACGDGLANPDVEVAVAVAVVHEEEADGAWCG